VYVALTKAVSGHHYCYTLNGSTSPDTAKDRTILCFLGRKYKAINLFGNLSCDFYISMQKLADFQDMLSSLSHRIITLSVQIPR
jgi:hypothetical protein